MAEGKIPVPFSIKHSYFSGTTDNYGRIFIDFDISNKVIVELLSGENSHIVLQLRLSNNKLGAKFVMSDDMSIVPNRGVSLNVYYIDRIA